MTQFSVVYHLVGGIKLILRKHHKDYMVHYFIHSFACYQIFIGSHVSVTFILIVARILKQKKEQEINVKYK